MLLTIRIELLVGLLTISRYVITSFFLSSSSSFFILRLILVWEYSHIQIVINSNITPDCQYVRKSDDFHKFVEGPNPNGTASLPIGLGFHADSIEQANVFFHAASLAIDIVKLR
jgi:hypothetical protein